MKLTVSFPFIFITLLQAYAQALPKRICQIAIFADHSFQKDHGKNTEQFIRSQVRAASNAITEAFNISLKIKTIALEKGSSRNDYTLPSLANHTREHFGNYPDMKNICFFLGLRSHRSSHPGPVGISPVAQVCKGEALVVANAGDRVQTTLIHEIGHMLGALHDIGNPCAGKGYAMGHNRTFPENRYKFSHCSKESIIPKLAGYKCLQLELKNRTLGEVNNVNGTVNITNTLTDIVASSANALSVGFTGLISIIFF